MIQIGVFCLSPRKGIVGVIIVRKLSAHARNNRTKGALFRCWVYPQRRGRRPTPSMGSLLDWEKIVR